MKLRLRTKYSPCMLLRDLLSIGHHALSHMNDLHHGRPQLQGWISIASLVVYEMGLGEKLYQIAQVT